MKSKKLKPLFNAIDANALFYPRIKHLARNFLYDTPYRDAEPVTEIDSMIFEGTRRCHRDMMASNISERVVSVRRTRPRLRHDGAGHRTVVSRKAFVCWTVTRIQSMMALWA